MSEIKRILILYADAGFGHRMAANAVAAALQDKYGDACLVKMLNPLDDKRTPTVLRESQADYDKMVRRAPELYKVGYQASDATVPSTLMESGLIVLLFEVMRDIIRRYRPDAIVSTYPLYQAPLDAVFTLTRPRIPVISVVTDLATVHRLWFNDAVDMCLVPNETVRDLALDAGLTPRQVKITGIPVSPEVVRETRSAVEVRRELGWKPNLPTILAVGSKRVEAFPEMLRAINHSGLPVQLAVVAGGDEALHQQLIETDWHLPTHIYDFVSNMPTLMHASDIVMSKAGGLIVTESMACGRPMILFGVLPGQEEGNADYVINAGAGELAQDALDALESVYHWIANGGKLLAERAENARRLGRPHSAIDVAELAWVAAQHGPYRRLGRRAVARTHLLDLLNDNEITVHRRILHDRANGGKDDEN
jgi:1,2-diacylglycerol 3-beta-galactosyltransferase